MPVSRAGLPALETDPCPREGFSSRPPSGGVSLGTTGGRNSAGAAAVPGALYARDITVTLGGLQSALVRVQPVLGMGLDRSTQTTGDPNIFTRGPRRCAGLSR
jgi:hypothetical protein